MWAQQSVNGVFENPDATPEQRAADIVSRMTLEEKVRQMQNAAPAIPRLGIPAYDWWNEGLHGVARAGLATVFPQAIGMAATWDTDLVSRIGDVVSTEARAKYNDAAAHGNHERYFGLTFWSPNINIFRDPRWGRGQETYGEDPYLTSRIGVAFVKGLQGTDPKYFKVIATPKHFAVHSGPEPLRHGFNVNVDSDDLRDTYLPAFKATVEEGRAYSVMCAYNAVDGIPACANTNLIEHYLREQWKFNGFVTSDCGAVDDIYHGHHYKPTMAAASAAAVLAGTDLTCGTEYVSLIEAVKSGAISEAQIDESLRRLFIARIRLGMFDPPSRVPFARFTMNEVDSEHHRALALEAAEKSMVLLKNDRRILPLSSSVKKIAVLGPTADDPDVLLGNYNGIPSRLVTPFTGLRNRLGAAASISFAAGSMYTAGAAGLVPSSVLTTALGEGLQAEYFDTPDLSGAPVLSRTEPRGYFRWDMHDPAVVQKVRRESFSLRWQTNLRVTQAGDYAIGLKRLPCADCRGNDSARLFIDDKPVLQHDAHVGWEPETKTVPVHLEVGVSHKIRVEYSQRGGAAGLQLVWLPPADALLREARQVIGKADMAIVCVGLNSYLEGEESKVKTEGFEGGDRTTLALPRPQRELLNTAYSSGKPVVVVLLNGSALGLADDKRRATAILEAWYPGQDGGTAIAATLAGDYNPSGKLPVTFYESVDQLPAFTDYSMKGRTYRYFHGRPVYPFGHGLSYSDFAYSDLHINGFKVSVKISNHSARAGEEVVQLYITPRLGTRGLIRQLAGFQRVKLQPNESRTVKFTLAPDSAPAKVSVGSGQPVPESTGNRFIEKELP